MFYTRQQSFGPVEGYQVGMAPTGKPIKAVYLYRLGSLLIDTGPWHLRRQVNAMLGSSEVTSILLTHHHEDHSGNAALLQKRFGAPVYLHPYGVSKLSQGFNILPYQHLLFGKAPRLQAEPCPETIEGDDFSLTPIHTPGHSKDHTVYYLRDEGWLFSGDLWVAEKIQFFRVDERIEQQIASLKRIAALDFESLFCAHRPAAKDGKALVQRKLDYLITFREKVLELHRHGALEKEIIARLRQKNDLPVKLFTMGNASFRHMVRSAIASEPDRR